MRTLALALLFLFAPTALTAPIRLKDSGFQRLGPPEDGDWRAEHPEETFQSVAQYLLVI